MGKRLDLRPTWVTTSPRERIEFVSQGPTVNSSCNHVTNLGTPKVGLYKACTNAGREVAVATTFCTAAPYSCKVI